MMKCSFCHKAQSEVKKLVAGPQVNICNECVNLCNDICRSEKDGTKSFEKIALSAPQDIHHFLDNYVIGQNDAKKVLSVALYNHYKRINAQDDKKAPVELQKSNILLIGPTGTGKTLLAQSLARMMKVPFSIVDATTLTEAGYVGEDVSSILQNLLASADNNVELAERGIVYIDEIDKVARKGEGPSTSRDVSGEGVQQGLLKLIEGTTATISPRGNKKYGQGEQSVQLKTHNILFICGGAFVGLDSIIQRRIGKKSIGFSKSDSMTDKSKVFFETLKEVNTDDLVLFGLIPEIVGRLPILAALDDVSEEDLVRILSEPKNALVRQYQKLFALEHVDLHFSKEALHAIAKQAIVRKSGARGLRAVLEDVMLDIMYEVPFMDNIKSCTITEDVVTKKEKPALGWHERLKQGT